MRTVPPVVPVWNFFVRPLDMIVVPSWIMQIANEDEARSVAARAAHFEMLKIREPYIKTILTEAMTRPRQMPDGSTLPPMKQNEIVVFVAQKDDPCVPPMLAMQCQDGDDVIVYVMERSGFAEAMQTMPIQYCDKCGRGSIKGGVPICPGCSEAATEQWYCDYPYKGTGKVLSHPAPGNQIYIAVFSGGMSTMVIAPFLLDQVETNSAVPDSGNALPSNAQ